MGGRRCVRHVDRPGSGADWSITSANAINNLGQIAGFGVHNGNPRLPSTPIQQ
jgi:hypothetical protein